MNAIGKNYRNISKKRNCLNLNRKLFEFLFFFVSRHVMI